MADWSVRSKKSVAFEAGVSQRRFESGRRQTVTVNACTLWQGDLNLSATSPMTTSDAETDVKLNIYIYIAVSLLSADTAKTNALDLRTRRGLDFNWSRERQRQH